MTEFNTLKRNYFRTQQTIYTSSDNKYNNTADLEDAVLATKLTLSLTEVSAPQSWRTYFAAEGYTDAFTRNLSDLWYRWLGANGFTQSSLRDRFRAFYLDGTVNL